MSGPLSLLLAALPLVATARPASVPPPSTLTAPAIHEVRAGAADLEQTLENAAPTLRPEALHAALASYDALRARGEVARPLLTVIDYGLPSRSKRLWVFDLAARKLLFHELVAHGRNSGEDEARSFSNEDGSYMTSLGAFVTAGTYDGKNGYSLRLRGLDRGRNDHAEARAIVVHGAPYVDEKVAETLGRLGRSHGCPALRPAIAKELIDEIKGSSLLYAWHPSMQGATSAAVAAVR